MCKVRIDYDPKPEIDDTKNEINLYFLIRNDTLKYGDTDVDRHLPSPEPYHQVLFRTIGNT